MSKMRLFFSLLGLLALSAVIWYLGPLVKIGERVPLETEMSRLIAIMVVVVLWALNLVRKALGARSANAKLAEGIAESKEDGKPERPPARMSDAERRSWEEVQVLRKRFVEATEVLRKSTKGAGANLYELPWYIIIGPPGSGKTTVLKNSGLDFPLADKFGTEALRGVGGTRNCDWWFTDEAILLDTAGRYVTQDSDKSADAAAWSGFLDLLKRNRKRRPINGILVAISLSDLMLQDEREREGHVRAIKSRINELGERFGMRLPVYVLLTKVDLVAGFMEFFDDLGREERFQTWGTTFDLAEPDAVAKFGEEFDLLLGRLNDRLMTRLDAERDPQRRSLIYGFPQQLATLKQSVEGFLHEIFRATRYDEPPLLRGVYFTSGTQEGAPIDRVMGSIARGFGIDTRALAAFRGQGRSYFVTDLLRKVVFNESELVGTNRRVERARVWTQRVAYALALAAVIGAIAAWSTAFSRNQTYVARMDERVKAYEEASKEEVTSETRFDTLLARLDKLHETTDVYRGYTDEHPIAAELGLYQGRRLGGESESAYLRELNRLLAPRIAARIAEQIRAGARDTDFLYAGLKTYLMLKLTDRLEPDYLRTWMQIDWEQTYPRNPDIVERLGRHLEALLAGGLQPVTLDDNTIAEARLTLNQKPLAELIYGRVKRDALNSSLPAFVPAEVLGPLGSKVFERASDTPLDHPIPAFYTYRGYYELYQKESKTLAATVKKENWVLENDRDELSSAELARLDVDMSQLYFTEYARVWMDLVNDLKVVRFRNPEHGLQVLETLSGRNSPMRAILEAIETNTSLTRLPGGASKIAEKVSSGLQSTRDELKKLMGGAGAAASKGAAPEPLVPGAEVEDRFAELNAIVRPDKAGVRPIDQIVELLGKVYGEVDQINSTEQIIERGKPLAADALPMSRRLKEVAVGQPQPLKDWLLQLTGSATQVSESKIKGDVEKQQGAEKKAIVEVVVGDWQTDILPFCNKAIMNRYPVARNAPNESTIKDFGRFFGPGGMLDTFVKDKLKAFIDSSSDPWRWKAANDISLGLSDELLRQLETAATIRDTYFHDGGQTPSVEFALKPIHLDKDVSQFVLDIGGQKYNYAHGPGQFRNAKWPAPDGTLDVRMGFEFAGAPPAMITVEGPWALYRLFDRMKLEKVTADRLVATFTLQGHTAQYEIRATSVINPFLASTIQSFKCPAKP
ncbi:MAG: type VI secretion system membrane subunit TssM [Gammaproteobacteria bacterium]